MKKYKVYAKFLGYVLPEDSFEIDGCRIERMSYREQKNRKFAPLKGWVSRWPGRNFMSFPRGADFRVMRSNFTISTILDCSSPNEAIGLAEEKFNKIIGAWMLYTSNWWLKKHPESKIRFSDYDYQICKVYEIANNKEIEIKDLRPVSTHASLCNYPASTELTDDLNGLIVNYINCKDEIFEKALKYFVNGIRGLNAHLPEEKIFLDLFKSIELIVDSFRRKRAKKFKVKLNYCIKRLGLSKDDKDKIIQFWETRSKGDFAHARKRKSYLPPQYPAPSDCELFLDWYSLINLAQQILIKYFNLINNRYEIAINNLQSKELDFEEGLCQELDFKMNSRYIFITKEKNKSKISQLVKKALAQHIDVDFKRLSIVENKKNRLIVKIK